jgi:DNA-binding PadR family transcriptional regulator
MHTAYVSIKHGLLALLERQPMHGYQLRVEFEAGTGATWPLNLGQVYSTLARLERDGFVTTSDHPAGSDERQRVYAITPAGQAEVRSWFDRPVRHESPRRDELAIKLALAVQTPGVDVLAVIQAQRVATIRLLQEYTRSREAAGDDLSWLLVADSLIFTAEAEVRWLDHCESRLIRSQDAYQPRPVEPTDAPPMPAPVSATSSARRPE